MIEDGPRDLSGLPQGWDVLPLRDLLEDGSLSYGIVQPGSEDAEGVPIVRVKDLQQGAIDSSEPLRVASSIEATYTRTRLRGGEVLLSLVGSVGLSAVVPEELRGWNVASGLAR